MNQLTPEEEQKILNSAPTGTLVLMLLVGIWPSVLLNVINRAVMMFYSLYS